MVSGARSCILVFCERVHCDKILEKQELSMESNKRIVFMVSGAMDSLLGAAALLAYFGVLPFDISDWGIPRWMIGLIGALLFFSGIAVFTYFLTRSDASE